MNSSGSTEKYSFKPFKWELIEPISTCKIPCPRDGHRIVCSSKYLYLFGGYNPCSEFPSSMSLQELWRYNYATKRWKQCAKDQVFPRGVVSASVVRKRHKLLVFGGTGVPFGLAASNELHSIKLNTHPEQFSKIEIAGIPPPPLYGQAITMQKSTLYAVGGTDGFVYKCDVHQVNLNKKEKIWRPLYVNKRKKTDENSEYEPEGRYRHEVGFDGENIYVLGGGTACHVFDLIDVPVFNINTRKWQKIKTKEDPQSDPGFPPARRCHNVAQLKTGTWTHLFVVGGYENNAHVFGDVWRLELPSLQWKLIQGCSLPRGVFLHSSAVTREGKMYVFGGIEEGSNLQRTNKMYAAWLHVPKLTEICWEAVLYYFPQITSFEKETVKNLNVPVQFVDRLE